MSACPSVKRDWGMSLPPIQCPGTHSIGKYARVGNTQTIHSQQLFPFLAEGQKVLEDFPGYLIP